MVAHRSKAFASLCPLHRCLPAAVVFLFTLLLMSSTALAQTSQGSINGKVSDAHGLAVPSAAVVVTSVDTGLKTTTTSDGAGLYNVPGLTAGNYTVTVDAKGFRKQLTNNVIVNAATTAVINVTVIVGSNDTTVTVTSQSDLLSNTSDVSTTVDHQIVENLPYPERSSLEAVLLVPGVTGDPFTPGGIGTENPSAYTGTVTPGASITVGGSFPGSAAILIDGSDVTQASYPRAGVNLSGRDVSETTAITSGMSAKYGRTGAGAIVQASQGGTSQYHGGVTWRHTDPWFNATPFGSVTKGDVHEQFYGFYAGGPVFIPKLYPRKDKTFFFVGVEPARLRTVISARGQFKTPDELAGHFFNSVNILNTTILKASGYAAALQAARIGETMTGATHGSSLYYNAPTNAAGFPDGVVYPNSATNAQHPITGPLADCSNVYAISPNPGATTCVDDVGPQLAQNPFAMLVNSLMPTPTAPQGVVFDYPNGAAETDLSNAYYYRGVQNIDNRYNFRIDHQFNNSNQIYGRYTVIPVSGARFFAVNTNNPLNQTPIDAAKTHDIAIGYTHIFSSNIVNNLHYSFLRDFQSRLPPAITTTQDYPAEYGLTPAVFGFGFPNLGGFSTNGTSYTIVPGNLTGGASYQKDQNFIGGDDVSWTKGAHLFQFGVDIRWIQSNQYDLSGSTGGSYGFSNAQTDNGSVGGDNLASFDLGIINSFKDTPVTVPGYYRWRYNAAYFQDDWRASSKLTLNLGIRYEFETPRREKFNNQAFVYTNIPGNTPSGVATTNAFCFSGSCGTPRSLWPTNYYGIEPRIGISYAVSPRSTLRTSYTMSRVPLTGYNSVPDPDFNISGTTVSSTVGGVSPITNFETDWITNPVGPLTSVFAALNGGHGPFFWSTGLSPDFVSQSKAVPYIQTWSLTYQFQPAQKTLIQATYQGTKGTHLIGANDEAFNTPPLAALQNAVANNVYLSGQQANPYGVSNLTAAGVPSGVINETQLQDLEPYQNFFNVSLPNIYPREGELHYNAMYLSVNQRFNKNITLLANYTWSKSLDDVPDVFSGTQTGNSNQTTEQSPFETSDDYAVSSFDQPSRLKVGYNAVMPWGIGQRFHTGNGIIDRIIGNMTTSGIMTSASGFTNYVTLGTGGYFTSLTPTGTPAVGANTACGASTTTHFCTSGGIPSGYSLRPNLVRGVPLINPKWKTNPYNSLGAGGITDYLNPAAFAIPGAPGAPQLGNAPRDLANARTPRQFLYDMNFVKGFTIRDRYQFKVTGTFINIFNHFVYSGISTHTVDSTLSPSTTASTTVAGAWAAGTNTANASFSNLTNNGGNRTILVGAEFNF
jgi:hypothetical protein